MGVPVLLVHFWSYWERASMRDLEGAILPSDAPIHITVSWAVGALMSFLADTYRRQMFVNHKLAATAAEKELRETQVRLRHALCLCMLWFAAALPPVLLMIP